MADSRRRPNLKIRFGMISQIATIGVSCLQAMMKTAFLIKSVAAACLLAFAGYLFAFATIPATQAQVTIIFGPFSPSLSVQSTSSSAL